MADQERQFKEWVEKYKAILIRIVRSFAAQPSDHDDLFQEILLQLWISLPKFAGQSEESTWIYRVAFNTALTWKRGKKRKSKNLHLLSLDQIPETETKQNPDSDAGQMVEKLYQAIHSLSIVDASLILLALDGLSYKQTAEVLGITENSVGVRLTRAKAKLAELLKGQIDEL